MKLLKAQAEVTKDTLKGYATVETMDREGDIIRVDGLKLDVPEGSTLKVFGTTHRYGTLPNGEVPIVGTIDKFTKGSRVVDGKPTPAATFEMQWAKDGEGNLTEYASKFKGLFDSGTLDSFSVGINPIETKPLKGGRLDITKSACFELSVAPLPMNKYATVIKSMKSALGDDADVDSIIEARLIELTKAIDGINPSLGKVLDRLDAIESSLVDMSVGQTDKTIDRNKSVDDLQQVAKALASLSSKLNK